MEFGIFYGIYSHKNNKNIGSILNMLSFYRVRINYARVEIKSFIDKKIYCNTRECTNLRLPFFNIAGLYKF